MHPHELLALENLLPQFKDWDCNGYLSLFLRNENRQYRGEKFLEELTKQFPLIFKVLADQQEFDIAPHFYVKAGVQAGDDLLKFFIQVVPNVKDQVDLEVVFPELMKKHWNIMASWPEFASRAEWVETLALRWPSSFQFAAPALQNDVAYVTQLILKQPACFRYASATLRDNLSIALVAVNLHEGNFSYVGQIASLNYDLCHLAISKNPKQIQQISLTHPHYARLLDYALEKDPSIVHLVPKHLFDPKKKLDQLPQHASLHLAYGATPTRLKVKQTKSMDIADQGHVQIFLIHQKELQTFTLPYQKASTTTTSYQLLNLDLRQQSPDQERFLAWQEELSEAGAMQLQLQNVGIEILTS